MVSVQENFALKQRILAMPDRIHLTVATVVEKHQKFLMVRETENGIKVINQPAGHVEPGEDVIAAALRETMEETGWKVKINGFISFSNSKSYTTGVTYYRLVFAAEPVQFYPDTIVDDDIDSWHWMSIEEINDPANIHRSKMVSTAIADYRANRIFPLDIFYNDL